MGGGGTKEGKKEQEGLARDLLCVLQEKKESNMISER